MSRSWAEISWGGGLVILFLWVKGGRRGGWERYLGGFVFGGGDEVGAIGGHLQVCDLHALFVRFDVFEEFAGLWAMVKNAFSDQREKLGYLRIIL